MKNIVVIFLILLLLLTLVSTFGGSIRYTETFELDPSEAMNMTQSSMQDGVVEDATDKVVVSQPEEFEVHAQEQKAKAKPATTEQHIPEHVPESQTGVSLTSLGDMNGFDGDVYAPAS